MTRKRKTEQRKKRKILDIAKTTNIKKKDMNEISGGMQNPTGDVINTIVRPDRHSS